MSVGSGRLLIRPIDHERDHVRGGSTPGRSVALLVYGDFLCPYCRRLRQVLERLRRALGEHLAYVFRHFPNERAHPGAEGHEHGARMCAFVREMAEDIREMLAQRAP